MARKASLAAPESLSPAIGAMIFASDEPVRPKEISEALGGIAIGEVEEAIRDLDKHFEKSAVGLRIEWIAGGVRLATRPEVAPWVRQFFRQRNRTRLSLPALETLAIVAYRQPATAPEIQAIRSKDPVASLKGLLDKKLIRIMGRKKVVGSPLLYGTTREFLHHFGLNSLEDLPSIEDFDQFVSALEGPDGVLADLEEEASPGVDESGDDKAVVVPPEGSGDA